MKISFNKILAPVFAATVLAACHKADSFTPKDGIAISDIYGTFDGMGSARIFEARFSNDTIYFDVPYFYPVDSDNEMRLDKIILRATISQDAVITPALGTVMDLTNPVELTITPGLGTPKKYVVVARKVGDQTLYEANLHYRDGDGVDQTIQGVKQENGEFLFYALPGMVMQNPTITYTINRHSTASIAQGGSVDVSNPIKLRVISIDGSYKEHTLRVAEPVKQEYGFGIHRRLWTKTAADLGIVNGAESGIAVLGDEFILARSMRIYNRWTGEYVKTLDPANNPYTALSGTNNLVMQFTNDHAGNVLASNFGTMNNKLWLYRYSNSFDEAPTLMLDWTVTDVSGYGGTAEKAAGRRINIYGDLKGDALIMATVSVTDVTYIWEVRGGVITDPTPKYVKYLPANGASMGYIFESQPLSIHADGQFIINSQNDLSLVDGSGNRVAKMEFNSGVLFKNATFVIEFNNARYMFLNEFWWSYNSVIYMGVYDITSLARISTPLNAPNYNEFQVYKSETLTGGTNGNSTSDITVVTSHDGDRMQAYMLLTNGGIMAHEFTNYKP